MQSHTSFGFTRVAAAVPLLHVADCPYNAAQIVALAQEAEQQNAQIICFPELCITGYTCADLFFSQQLQKDAWQALTTVQEANKKAAAIWIVGMPIYLNGGLYNTAIVLQQGKIMGIVPKTHLPNNGEFYEKRWFQSGSIATEKCINIHGESIPFGVDLLFDAEFFRFGIEICEDLWCPLPPSTQLSLQGAEVIFNLSASNELIGKQDYRRQLVAQQSARTHTAYIYVSAGSGESTTDLVFAGSSLIAENGNLLAEGKRFCITPQLSVTDVDIDRLKTDRLRNTNFLANKQGEYRLVKCSINELDIQEIGMLRQIERLPFVPSAEMRTTNCQEIFNIQTAGLAKRWKHTQAQTLVLGISGGLDSTLALLVCVRTADLLGFDRKRIVGITMPGFGTTDRTYNNAVELMKALHITQREISIKEASLLHFSDIGHDANVHDITYENTQARERTQILMDLANQLNGLVVGTGDLSELALGWATYNGDHMSMYAVNAGVPKTLVRYLVATAAEELDKQSSDILTDVLNTPVSPELLPASKDGSIAQKTEDVVGPYELHDFFLYYFLRFGFSKKKIAFLAHEAFKNIYNDETINKWLTTFMRRFFQQQFKRSCMPDGPKVGSVNLSPRGDWRMPSDAICFENQE